MRRTTLILALGLVLAACAGQESAETIAQAGSGPDGRSLAADEAVSGGSETTAAAEAMTSDDQVVSVDLVSNGRKVIHNAHLQLRADDTRDAYRQIVSLTEMTGGFVANATVAPVESEDESPEISLTLRIPADGLATTLDGIKDAADEVISESQEAQDITDQYVDLDARLTNLTALEAELRALLAEVRKQPDADPQKLLQVFSEISNTRGQIEQIQGQLNYLDDVVALATVDVQLSPTPAAVPIVEDTWRPREVARDAVRQLVSGLQDIADWGIGFALATLPLLLLFLGLPLLIVLMVYRRWRGRHPATPPAPAQP